MKYLIAVSLLALLGLASTMDFEDAKLEEAHYCDMVSQGVWPDYNNNYGDICE